MTTGEKLRYFRRSRGYTQDELARAIGANRVTVSNYEHDNYKPSVAALLKLCFALSINPDELVQPNEEDKSSHLPTDDDIKAAVFGTTKVDRKTFEALKLFARFLLSNEALLALHIAQSYEEDTEDEDEQGVQDDLDDQADRDEQGGLDDTDQDAEFAELPA